ncbi:MAG: hypothetical protein HFJ24_08880 [Clostridia bacterium]|nr:hypothetical protein [Clostridia bacterium]
MNESSIRKRKFRKCDLEDIKEFHKSVKESFPNNIKIQEMANAEILEIDKLLLKFKSGT